MGVETALIVGAAVLGGVAAATAMKAQIKTPKAGMDRGVELSRKLDADYPREVAVGLFSTGGSGGYDCVAGEKNKYLYRVTLLSDYEITAFRELWLDGEKMTLSGDPMAGWVNVTGRYQKGDEDATPGPAIRLRVMSGTEGQALEPELASANPVDKNGNKELGPNDRFAGLAYAILRFELDQEAFQGGEPEAYFVGEGAPVHDPRDEDSDPDDASTWSRTSDARFNAALVTAQAMRGWKRNGEIIVGAEGLHLYDIPEDRLSDAADICDEDRATPDGVEPRYRVGGMVRMDPERGIRPSLEKLLAAMDGDLIEDGGEFIILPGAPRTPTSTYDLQAIGGRCVAFDPYGGSTQRYNQAECTFVDPEAAWGEQTLPLYAPAAYRAADNGRPRTLSIGLELCPYRYQAAAIQKEKLDRARLIGAATFDLPLIAKKDQPGDWITVTDEVTGQIAAVWEVERSQRINTRDRGARVILECREIAVTPYQFGAGDAEAAEGVPTVPPDRTYPSPGVPVLTLTAVYVEGGGAKEPAIKVEATIPESPAETHIDYEWRQKAEPDRLYTRTQEKARGGFVIREGIVPSQVFEVRARLSSAKRKGEWSAWGEATAPADYTVPGANTISGKTREQIEQAEKEAIRTGKEAAESLIAEISERRIKVKRVDVLARNLFETERTERIAADASEASTRTTQISTLNGNIAAVETEVTTVATDLAAETSTRTTQISQVNDAIAAVETEVETVASDLAAETSARTTQISEINDSIAGVETQVTTLASDLAAETNTRTVQFSALGDDIAAVESDITTLTTDLAAETSARQTQVSTLNGNVATLTTQYNTLATAQSSQATALSSLEATVTTQGATLSALATDFTIVEANVDTLLAARIIRVGAGSGFAEIQLTAEDSGGQTATEVAITGQVLSFGAQGQSKRRKFDAAGGSEYALGPDGVTKTFELNWANGRLQTRNSSGAVLFDTGAGGAQYDGLPVITGTQTFENDASVSLSATTWTEVGSVSITTLAASRVLLMWQCYLSGSTTSSGGSISARLKRGASVIWEEAIAEMDPQQQLTFYDNGVAQAGSYVLLPGSVKSIVSAFDLDTPGAAGSQTYTLEIYSAVGISVRDRKLVALDLRRAA